MTSVPALPTSRDSAANYQRRRLGSPPNWRRTSQDRDSHSGPGPSPTRTSRSRLRRYCVVTPSRWGCVREREKYLHLIDTR